MMTQGERVALFERLLEALESRVVTTELLNWFPGQSWYLIPGPGTPRPVITARVRDYEPRHGIWLYWWSWRQPIQSLDELERVMMRFCDMVLAVEGRHG